MASTWQSVLPLSRVTGTACSRGGDCFSERVHAASGPQTAATSSCWEGGEAFSSSAQKRAERGGPPSCRASQGERKEEVAGARAKYGGGVGVSATSRSRRWRWPSAVVAPRGRAADDVSTKVLWRNFVCEIGEASSFKLCDGCRNLRRRCAVRGGRSARSPMRRAGAPPHRRHGGALEAGATWRHISSWVFDPLYLSRAPSDGGKEDPSAPRGSGVFSPLTVLGLITGTRGPQKPGPTTDGKSITPSSSSSSSSSSRRSSSILGAEDSSPSLGDFFKGKLPSKMVTLLLFLALSRLGVYVPLPGVDIQAFSSQLDQSGILGTLDTLSGGGIGRLGIFSLGIVPFINSQIVFQLVSSLFPKLQDLQKKEGEAGRRKFLQYTRYGALAFALAQAVGQCLYIRPYVYHLDLEWFVASACTLTAGSMIVMWIGEQISELKIGNGTSILIFTNILSYLPASVGRTVQQAIADNNYLGLAAIAGGFLGLVFGIVYVQEAERKIPMNYASRFRADNRGLGRSSYLPFKVNSSGVMPIIFSSSLLAAPAALARFSGVGLLRSAAIALNPTGPIYLPTNVALIAFFNYFYTFLQLDPNDVSEQLKRQGASIPSVRPGRATANYITNVLTRMSILGSVFLGFLALAPALVESVTHLTTFRGFAGTSVLILVGSATDTARKVEAELVSQKYLLTVADKLDDSAK